MDCPECYIAEEGFAQLSRGQIALRLIPAVLALLALIFGSPIERTADPRCPAAAHGDRSAVGAPDPCLKKP